MLTLNNYPESIIQEFLLDQCYDFLAEQDNRIFAYCYELHHHPLLGDIEVTVIRKTWDNIKEFDTYLTQWYHEYCEREDAVGSYLGSLGLI